MEYEKAIRDLNKAIKLNPNEPYYYFAKGYNYYRIAKYKKAIKEFNKAISIKNNVIENNDTIDKAYYYRAKCFSTIGEYQSAVKDYKKTMFYSSVEPYSLLMMKFYDKEENIKFFIEEKLLSKIKNLRENLVEVIGSEFPPCRIKTEKELSKNKYQIIIHNKLVYSFDFENKEIDDILDRIISNLKDIIIKHKDILIEE